MHVAGMEFTVIRKHSTDHVTTLDAESLLFDCETVTEHASSTSFISKMARPSCLLDAVLLGRLHPALVKSFIFSDRFLRATSRIECTTCLFQVHHSSMCPSEFTTSANLSASDTKSRLKALHLSHGELHLTEHAAVFTSPSVICAQFFRLLEL